MENSDKFKKNLKAYRLSEIEIEIIVVLFDNSPLKIVEIFEILKKLKITITKPKINKILNDLFKKSWIKCTSQSPKAYSKLSKKDFQVKLDSEILKSQELFQTQKNNYYDLLDAIKRLETHTQDEIKSGVQIPSKTPEFIATWIHSILNSNPWEMVKIETNMIIALRKEGINFRLNSAEFTFNLEKVQFYGGFNLCQMENLEDQLGLLKRIHDYSVDGRKFQYKLEKKGYIENKTRKLISYNFDEPKLDVEHNKYSTSYSIEEKSGTTEGNIISFPIANTKSFICSLWGENPIFITEIQKQISNFKPNE